MCLTPIFLGGGHYDDSISFWEEILYGRLQKSILQPLIFSFRGWEVFLFPLTAAVNIVAPASHVFGDLLEHCIGIIRSFYKTNFEMVF